MTMYWMDMKIYMDLKSKNLTDDFCVVRSEVLPSQRQGQKTTMYQAWVIVDRRNSYIFTANCMCMAGYVTSSYISYLKVLYLRVNYAVMLAEISK